MGTETLTLVIQGRNETGDAIGGARSGLAGLGNVAKGLAVGGLAVAGAAAAGLAAGLVSSVGAAMEAQPVHQKLAAILRNTGAASGVTAEQAEALATKFQALTTFEDEAIIAGQTVLGTFEAIGKDVFPAATQSMLNLATKMGSDTPAAAEILARALGGDSRALLTLQKEIGPFTAEQKKLMAEFKAAGDTAGYQNAMLAAVEAKIGGLATAMGQTASGQFTIFNNQMGDIKETIGTALLPALTSLATTLTTALNKPEVQAGIASLVQSLSTLAADALPPLINFLTTTAIPAMITLATLLSGQVNPATTGLGTALAGVQSFLQPLINALGPLAEAMMGFWNVVSPLLIPALEAIGNVVTTIILPILGEQMMAMLTTLIEAFTGFVTFLTGAVEMIVGLFTGDMDGARAGAQKVVDGILQIFTSMAEGVMISVTNLVGMIVGAFNQLGVDIVGIGKNIIDGLIKGIMDNAAAVATALDSVVQGAVDGVLGFLGIQSPSRLFADIGSQMAEGLIQGLRGMAGATADEMRSLAQEALSGWFWGLRQLHMPKMGEGTYRELRERMEGFMRDLVITPGMNISEVVSTVQRQIIERLLTAESANRRNLGHMLESYRDEIGPWLDRITERMGMATEAMRLKLVANMLSVAGSLGSFGSAAASRYETQVLSPMKEQLAVLEAQLVAMREQGVSLKTQAETVELIRAKRKDIAESEKMLTRLARQQADLQFLQSQAELITMIRENGLNAQQILGGLKLGINADLQGVIQAMTRAMQTMVRAAERELGVASPSRVFAKLGEQALAGFGIGALQYAPVAARSVAAATGQVAQRVNNYYLSANYRYQSESTLAERVRLMQMVYG